MAQTTIEDTKDVYVAWSNTDLTEGRGGQIPKHVAEVYETAVRLGHKGSVQGCDCPVTKELAVKVGGKWLAPARILAGREWNGEVPLLTWEAAMDPRSRLRL